MERDDSSDDMNVSGSFTDELNVSGFTDELNVSGFSLAVSSLASRLSMDDSLVHDLFWSDDEGEIQPTADSTPHPRGPCHE